MNPLLVQGACLVIIITWYVWLNMRNKERNTVITKIKVMGDIGDISALFSSANLLVWECGVESIIILLMMLLEFLFVYSRFTFNIHEIVGFLFQENHWNDKKTWRNNFILEFYCNIVSFSFKQERGMHAANNCKTILRNRISELPAIHCSRWVKSWDII